MPEDNNVLYIYENFALKQLPQAYFELYYLYSYMHPFSIQLPWELVSTNFLLTV